MCVQICSPDQEHNQCGQSQRRPKCQTHQRLPHPHPHTLTPSPSHPHTLTHTVDLREEIFNLRQMIGGPHRPTTITTSSTTTSGSGSSSGSSGSKQEIRELRHKLRESEKLLSESTRSLHIVYSTMFVWPLASQRSYHTVNHTVFFLHTH